MVYKRASHPQYYIKRHEKIWFYFVSLVILFSVASSRTSAGLSKNAMHILYSYMYFTQLISQLPIFYKNRKHKRSVKLKTVDKAKTTSRHTPIQIMKLCLGAAHNSSNFSYLDTKLIFSGRKQSYHPNKYGHPLFIH